MLNGIQNVLLWLNNNWTGLTIIASLATALYFKIKAYLANSKEERIAIAKAQIKEVILKKVTDAEVEYAEWVKAGSVKRSKVIQELYMEYPILEKVADQAALTAWMDDTIDEALKTMRKIVAENTVPIEDMISNGTSAE